MSWSWIILLLAGACEVVWALGLKFSNGLSKPLEASVTVVFMILSLYLLALATREVPLSIGYTVWVGMGAIGAFLGGIFLFGEKLSVVQIVFFIMIVAGMIGLKVTSIGSDVS